MFFKSAQREFVLNQAEVCPDNRPALAKLTSLNFSMSHNFLSVKGNVTILQDLSKDLTIKMEFKRCKMHTNECSKKLEYPIPNICALLTTKTVFGPGIGSSFTPKVSCPIKRGNYAMNFKLDLNTLGSAPFDKTIYDINFIIFDEKKKKEITCIHNVMWAKHV